MIRIMPSTGAFIGRVNGRDHSLLLRVMDRIEADAFEFMMYEVFYGREEEIASDFLATGRSFPVLHVEKRIGELLSYGSEGLAEAETRFLANCRAALRLGAEKLVLHLWNGLPSDHEIGAHLAAYPRLAALAREHGLLLTVENVVCAAQDPLSHFAALADACPDVRFTFDTKMAAFHRQEGALSDPRYTPLLLPRLAHVHFNDYAGEPGDFSGLAVLHLGKGRLPLPEIAAALLRGGYSGTVTLECSSMGADGVLYPEQMNASLAAARALLCGEGASD